MATGTRAKYWINRGWAMSRLSEDTQHKVIISMSILCGLLVMSGCAVGGVGLMSLENRGAEYFSYGLLTAALPVGAATAFGSWKGLNACYPKQPRVALLPGSGSAATYASFGSPLAYQPLENGTP